MAPLVKPIQPIGAATDIGARHPGTSLGPEALRIAGIEKKIQELGYALKPWIDLEGPRSPWALPVKGLRHEKEVYDWCLHTRDATIKALRDGAIPLLLGGDHCLAIGTLAALSHQVKDRPVSVVWFDAHTDVNLPETSPSGNIHGMPIAVSIGKGSAMLKSLGAQTPMVDPRRIFQVGIRSVDSNEKIVLSESSIVCYDMYDIDSLGMNMVMDKVVEEASRDNAHIHVSFDMDFLDPSVAPGVGTPVVGGPSYREARLCMEKLAKTGQVQSIEIHELNPACDSQNQSSHVAIQLLAALLGEDLSRPHA